MFTVINNTLMQPVATTTTMEIACWWAETIPPQNDFSIIRHSGRELSPYTTNELRLLHSKCWNAPKLPDNMTYNDLLKAVLRALNNHPTTSEPPPDAKRVAPLINENNGDTIMALAKKKVAKKVAKKVVKKAAPKAKIERIVQNDVTRPAVGTKTASVWVIADALSKKAGAPAERKAVLDAADKKGINPSTAATQYQAWRKFNGLNK